jgi:probable HAF family extracellular repeat protein
MMSFGLNSLLPTKALPATATLSVAFVVAGANAQCQYEVTARIVGPRCEFDRRTLNPTGMNNLGHIIGYYLQCAAGGEQAFLWTPESGVVTLPRPGYADARAYDINDLGRIVGYVRRANTGSSCACLWEDGELIDLGALPGDSSSEARAINHHGQIVGYSVNPSTGPLRAFIWEDGEMKELDLPVGPSAVANAISDAGRIAGWMGSAPPPPFPTHAFLMTDGAAIDLGRSVHGLSAEAKAVNNQGWVVGSWLLNSDECCDVTSHPVVWRDGRPIDLGGIPEGWRGWAYDINDLNQVVGNYEISTRAFVWQHGVRSRLSDLVDPSEKLRVTGARAINERGQIAAVVRPDGDSQTIVGLLTPIETAEGDTDLDCQVSFHDLLRVLAAWGPCDGCREDVSGDGVVDDVDLSVVLDNWSGP